MNLSRNCIPRSATRRSRLLRLISKIVTFAGFAFIFGQFPDYLKDNEGKINTEDKKRYDSQYAIVIKIIAVFEDPSYSDEDTQKSVQILELMSEVSSPEMFRLVRSCFCRDRLHLSIAIASARRW